jgi:hypothetical protein
VLMAARNDSYAMRNRAGHRGSFQSPGAAGRAAGRLRILPSHPADWVA